MASGRRAPRACTVLPVPFSCELELPVLLAVLEEMLAHAAGERVELGAENRARAVIRDRQAELVVEHQHARRQVGEDVLQVRLRRLQRRAVRFDARGAPLPAGASSS